ncbi:MAG: ThuA domain-containing protein [Candidatus Brocadiia bacterium]
MHRTIVLLAATLGCGLAPAGEAPKPLRAHMLSGSREYKSEASLATLRGHLESQYHVACTLSRGKDKGRELPGLEALDEADVLVVFCRRMRLPDDQLARIQAWCRAGKPVVGIRTASHAFQTWLAFDKEVLGGDYKGHGGMEKAVRVLIEEEARDHPILAGVEEWTRACKMYHNPELAEDVAVLLSRESKKGREPLAWARVYDDARDGRSFYTPMGLPPDFENPNFLRLLANAIFWTAKREPRPKPPQ